eukprot:6161990-Pleurochrysis_carterae.AAC.1
MCAGCACVMPAACSSAKMRVWTASRSTTYSARCGVAGAPSSVCFFRYCTRQQRRVGVAEVEVVAAAREEQVADR